MKFSQMIEKVAMEKAALSSKFLAHASEVAGQKSKSLYEAKAFMPKGRMRDKVWMEANKRKRQSLNMAAHSLAEAGQDPLQITLKPIDPGAYDPKRYEGAEGWVRNLNLYHGSSREKLSVLKRLQRAQARQYNIPSYLQP